MEDGSYLQGHEKIWQVTSLIDIAYRRINCTLFGCYEDFALDCFDFPATTNSCVFTSQGMFVLGSQLHSDPSYLCTMFFFITDATTSSTVILDATTNPVLTPNATLSTTLMPNAATEVAYSAGEE